MPGRQFEAETARNKRRLHFIQSIFDLLTHLIDVLEGQTAAIDRFFDGPAGYFQDCEEARKQNYLPDIQDCVTKLKDNHRRLSKLQTRCATVTSLVCLHHLVRLTALSTPARGYLGPAAVRQNQCPLSRSLLILITSLASNYKQATAIA
jgi:hypothetical protein